MIVRVEPQRPIPGILPKNKWIDKPMELDLNKNEIIRCSQYGSVYYQNILVDNTNVDNIIKNIKKVSNKNIVVVEEQISESSIETATTSIGDTFTIDMQNQNSIDVSVNAEQTTESITIDNTKNEDYKLQLLSVSKNEDFVIVETEFNTEVGKIGGNMYGLFSIVGGNRPSTLEYNILDDSWIKFNNKFANLSVLENGNKFIFRFIPKNDLPIKFRIFIKEGNNVLAKLEGDIDPSNI